MADEQTPPEDELDPTADAGESTEPSNETDEPAAPEPAAPGAADSGGVAGELDDLGDLDEIANLGETPAGEPAAAGEADEPAAAGEADEPAAAGEADEPAAAGDAATAPPPDPGVDDDEIDADEAAAAAAAAEAEQRAAAAAAAAPAPDAGPDGEPAAPTFGPEVLTPVLGAAATPVTHFGARVGEVLQVGVESVGGRKAGYTITRAERCEFAQVEEEFATIPHLGLELKFAFSDVDSGGLGVLVPLADVGRLLTLETSPGAMSEPAFRAGQLETIATAARELLDLMSLALFTDELSGAEATLADQRFDDAGTTLAHVADTSGRSPTMRVDLQITLEGERAPVRCTVVVPESLLQRLAGLLAPGVAMPDGPDDFGDPLSEAAPEPTPLRRFAASGSPRVDSYGAPPAEEGGFGLNYDTATVSPIRPSATHGRAAEDVEVHPVRFPTLNETPAGDRGQRALDLIMDVQMRVSVELGRSSMSVEDILALGPGSVVELNKLAGEPVDILVNDHLIARGEVVVVDENFGVRVTEIVSANRRAFAMAR